MFYKIDMEHYMLGTTVMLVGVELSNTITVSHSILRGFRYGVIIEAYKERDIYKYRVVEATKGKYTVILIEPEFTVTRDSSFVCDRVRSQLREKGIHIGDLDR